MNRHHIVREDLDRINSADLPWDQLSGTTVLVTGANGFLPAYLVEALLYRNENHSKNPIKILALVRNRQKAAARFHDYEGRADLEFGSLTCGLHSAIRCKKITMFPKTSQFRIAFVGKTMCNNDSQYNWNILNQDKNVNKFKYTN